MDFPDGFDLWLLILKHNDLVLVVVFSLNLHSGASYIWCSFELVVCTSDSFDCPEASYFGFCCAILLVWMEYDLIFCSNQENARSLPKWKYQFVLSLYSRLSKFGLAINYLVTILFQEVLFWYLAACIFQLANLSPIIGSKDRMYVSSECSKNVKAYYMNIWIGHTWICRSTILHTLVHDCTCIVYIRSLGSSYDTNQILVCT